MGWPADALSRPWPLCSLKLHLAAEHGYSYLSLDWFLLIATEAIPTSAIQVIYFSCPKKLIDSCFRKAMDDEELCLLGSSQLGEVQLDPLTKAVAATAQPGLEDPWPEV